MIEIKPNQGNEGNNMSPTNELLFANADTGKVWYTGEDVACLAAELNITPADAESFLAYGLDAGQVLAIFGNAALWKKVCGSRNRVAFMKGCIKNQATRTKTPNAGHQAAQAASAPASAPDRRDRG
jgi:hypothetical protein